MPDGQEGPARDPDGDAGPGMLQQSQGEGWRNPTAFWILGVCNNYGYVVMLSAAHDILASKNNMSITVSTTSRDCNAMSTGAILLADIIPALLTKLIAPFLPLYIHVRMVLMIVLACAGYILVGASETTWVAVTGVVCTSISSGLGEATLLSYLSFFKNKNVITTWSSGTGGAGMLGAFSYAFIISTGLSDSTTLYLMLVVPVIMGITFWVLLERPIVGLSSEEGNNSGSGVAVNTTVNSDTIRLTYNNETFSQKFKSIPHLFKFMIPLGLVYFFEYFINQGLLELVYFDNLLTTHSEQYRWYQVFYQIGVFISRSSINLVKVNATWVLAVLQGMNVVLFGTEATFFYIPSVYIVVALVFWEGLLGGAAYVNTYHRINSEVAPEKREFSMAITTLADSIGITAAGFLSIPAHNYICGLPRNL